MKKVLLFSGIIATIFWFSSCDKVKNPYPVVVSSELDTTFYPGNWADYEANYLPDFSTITASSDRNAVIEDYTGHNCSNCPQAATVAHGQHTAHPDRVFVASIHATASGTGTGSFQSTTSQYTIDFTNTFGKEFGRYFFVEVANSGFVGNPAVNVSRTIDDNNYYFNSLGNTPNEVNAILSSPLKVKIKSKLNYFETTKGAYLHTEVESLDNSVTGNLAMMVYLIEDSIVGAQNVFGTYTPDYVHRDIYRGNISGQQWGRVLTPSLQDETGKFHLNFSFAVPNQLAPTGETGAHNAENMHVLILIYDKVTLEIYQVVKEKFV